MTETQEKAVVTLLRTLVHSAIQRPETPHAEKVQMLDELSDVKREFGMTDEHPEPA